MMLIFWGGLVAMVMFAARGAFGARSHHADGLRSEPNAQEILAQRFARGEISEEEFEQRKRVLESAA